MSEQPKPEQDLSELLRHRSQGTMAFLCGPPVMIRFVMQDLLAMGFTEDSIKLLQPGVRTCI